MTLAMGLSTALMTVIREDSLFVPLRGYQLGMYLRDEHLELMAVAMRRAADAAGAELHYPGICGGNGRG